MLNLVENGRTQLRPRERLSPGGLIVKEGVSPETFDLHDAQLFLDAVFANGEPTPKQYKDAVGILGQRQVLSSIISSVLEDPVLLEEVDSRSFLHSNGMERINLLSTPKYQLRLHLWWPGKREGATENPHDHVYNHASVEEEGDTVHEIYKRSQEGLPANWLEITSETATEQPKVEELGRVYLRPVSQKGGIIITDRMPAHFMGYNTVHQLSTNPYKQAFTLNLRGAAVKDRATNYKFPDVENPEPTVSRVNTAESLMRVLTTINPQTNTMSFR